MEDFVKMKRRGCFWSCMSILVSAGLLLTACGKGSHSSMSQVSDTSEVSAKESEQIAEISAIAGEGSDVYVWTVYWDMDHAFRTIYNCSNEISSVGIFAAYYTNDGKLKFSDDASALGSRLSYAKKTQKVPRYLTVVNDTEKEQKSLALTRRLLKDERSINCAVSDIVQMATDQQCYGVEIDFEKLREDIPLWNQFIRFENQLIQECRHKSLQVRIILETATPVDQIQLPEGPQYVVMCYNLYGYGTGPGPKADLAFLKKTVRKFEALRSVDFAIADGGFDFNQSGEVTAVTYQDAENKRSEFKKKSKRDPKSAALYFQYGSHTVWYADDETLRQWTLALQAASGRKVSISLWRI